MTHSLPLEIKEKEKKQFINDLHNFINKGTIHNTFTSKRLSKHSVFNSHKIGRCFVPVLIDIGLVSIVSKGSHAAVYKVDKERLADWLVMHS